MRNNLDKAVEILKKVEKQGSDALNKIINAGAESLMPVLRALDKLKQSHLEFELYGYAVILDKIEKS